MKITLKEELNRIKEIMGVKILSEQDFPRAVTNFSDDIIIKAIKEYIPKITSLAGGSTQGSYNKNLALNLLRDIAASSGKNINSFGKPNVNFKKYSTDKFGTKKIQSDVSFNPKGIDTKKLLSGFENLNPVQKADIVKKYTTEMIQLGIISPDSAVDAMIAHNDSDYQWVRWWMSGGQYQVIINGDVAQADRTYLDMPINKFMDALKIPQSMRYTIAERVKLSLTNGNYQINPNYTPQERTSLMGKEGGIKNMVPGQYTKEEFENSIALQVLENFTNQNNNPIRLYNSFMASNEPRFTELKKWLVKPENKNLFIKKLSQQPSDTQYEEAFNTLKREGLLSEEQITWAERHRKFCYTTVKGFKGDKSTLFGSEVGTGDEYTLEKMTNLCKIINTWVAMKIIFKIASIAGITGISWIFKHVFYGEEIEAVSDWASGCVSKQESDKFLAGDDTTLNSVDYDEIGMSKDDIKNLLPEIKNNSLYNFKKYRACDDLMLYMLIPQKGVDGTLDMTLSKKVFLAKDKTSKLVLRLVDSEQDLASSLKGDYDTFINRAKGAIEDAKKKAQGMASGGPVKDNTNTGLAPIKIAADSSDIVDD